MATAFVGRARQLGVLEAAAAAAAAGAGGLAMVTGEAGIGKTRLCEEAAVRAADRGLDVSRAACWESGAVPAYWPWQQLVRRLSGRRLVLPAGPGARAADPDLARAELFEEVTALLVQAAAQRPRLLIIDDLHWADVPSVRLLAHLAPELRQLPMLVLVSFRPDEVRPATALGTALVDLARHGDRVDLGGLPAAELVPLVASIAGGPPSPAVAEALHRHTHGNPLFARELVELLAKSGDVERLVAGCDPPVPDSVRGVLRRRLERLSVACRSALEVCAVAGDEFALADLPGTIDGLLDPIGEAEAAGVVRQSAVGHFAFTHPLLRAVLYDELGVVRRVRLHQRVGEALERRHGAGSPVDLAVLSHHFVRAAPGGTAAKAVAYATRAAERAMAVLAYEDAVALVHQALAALDLAPAAADRADLLLALGEALTAAGDQPAARASYVAAAALARAAGHTGQLARAALGIGSGGGFEIAPADREQVEALEEALRALDGTAPGLWSQVAARLSVALWRFGQVERRVVLARQALDTARSGGAAVTNRQLAAAVAAHCDAISGPEHAERRLAESTEVVDLGTASGDRAVELLGRRLRLVARLEVGDVAGADGEIEAYAAVAGALCQPLYGWYVPLWRGMRSLMRGDLVACEQWIDDAVTLGAQAHSANAEILGTGLRWYLLREAARFEDALPLLDVVTGLEPSLGIQVRVTAALVLAEGGRVDEARTVLAGAGPLLAGVPADGEWVPMAAQAAEAACLVGDRAVCRWAYDALLAHRHRFGVEGIGAVCWGSVERPLGLVAAALGQIDRATAHFDAALAANRRLGAPLLVARTQRDAGVALDDRDRLAAALAAYRRLGMEGRVAELESLLGDHPPTDAPAPAPDRFRREGEVWALAYGGVTAHVKDVKGMADLARLLARPGAEVAAIDLAGRRDLGGGTDLGEVLDARARQGYQARLVELEAELDAADAAGDGARSAAAHAERDALVAQLSAAYGLGGRPRRAGVSSERARGAVTWRIRDAIGRIEAVHPALGQHLRRFVRTGTYCSYDPDPPVAWSLAE
ncbi:MAG TPA: AAA family ATPase [Acidimicrobiales bacterium]|nr:AAA family ATPase [Acidimicrobiales bacterium]